MLNEFYQEWEEVFDLIAQMQEAVMKTLESHLEDRLPPSLGRLSH